MNDIVEMPLQSVWNQICPHLICLDAFDIMTTHEPSDTLFFTIHTGDKALQSNFIHFARKMMGPFLPFFTANTSTDDI